MKKKLMSVTIIVVMVIDVYKRQEREAVNE